MQSVIRSDQHLPPLVRLRHTRRVPPTRASRPGRHAATARAAGCNGTVHRETARRSGVRRNDAALDGRGTRAGRNRGVRLVASSQIPAPAPQETRAQTCLRTPDRHRITFILPMEIAAGGREGNRMVVTMQRAASGGRGLRRDPGPESHPARGPWIVPVFKCALRRKVRPGARMQPTSACV